MSDNTNIMNLTTTPEQDAIFANEAESRNQLLRAGDKPHTAESIALLLLDRSATGYAATHEAAAREALAQNDRLMDLGIAVAAQPDKLDEIEKAVAQILS